MAKKTIKPKAKTIAKKVVKKKTKFVKVNPSKISKEFDIIFKKYNINKGLMLLEFQVSDDNFHTLAVGHDISLKKGGELKLAKAILKLFNQIGFDTQSFEIVADILKQVKEGPNQKSPIQVKTEEKEKTLSTGELKKLQEIRDRKNAFVKKENWEEAAKCRNEELEFLKIN